MTSFSAQLISATIVLITGPIIIQIWRLFTYFLASTLLFRELFSQSSVKNKTNKTPHHLFFILIVAIYLPVRLLWIHRFSPGPLPHPQCYIQSLTHILLPQNFSGMILFIPSQISVTFPVAVTPDFMVFSNCKFHSTSLLDICSTWMHQPQFHLSPTIILRLIYSNQQMTRANPSCLPDLA